MGQGNVNVFISCPNIVFFPLSLLVFSVPCLNHVSVALAKVVEKRTYYYTVFGHFNAFDFKQRFEILVNVETMLRQTAAEIVMKPC